MIDFSTKLLDLAGAPISENGSEVTLGKIATNALLAPFPDEPNLPGEDKVKRFMLAMKIQQESALDLPVEDIALVKKLIAKAYAPLVVGRSWEILDPSPKG